jgi:hypothetical protein
MKLLPRPRLKPSWPTTRIAGDNMAKDNNQKKDLKKKASKTPKEKKAAKAEKKKSR